MSPLFPSSVERQRFKPTVLPITFIYTIYLLLYECDLLLSTYIDSPKRLMAYGDGQSMVNACTSKKQNTVIRDILTSRLFISFKLLWKIFIVMEFQWSSNCEIMFRRKCTARERKQKPCFVNEIVTFQIETVKSCPSLALSWSILTVVLEQG